MVDNSIIINYIKEDHKKIRYFLYTINSLIENNDKIMFGKIVILFNNLDKFWTEHEKREEKLFDLFRKNGTPFPTETMLLDQHREIRGHWKVLQLSLKTKDDEKLRVAFDTDGKMLIGKLLRHLDIEDGFFNKVS